MPERGLGVAEAREQVGPLRGQCQCAAVIRGGLAGEPGVEFRVSEFDVTIDEVRCERDREAVTGDRSGDVAETAQCSA